MFRLHFGTSRYGVRLFGKHAPVSFPSSSDSICLMTADKDERSDTRAPAGGLCVTYASKASSKCNFCQAVRMIEHCSVEKVPVVFSGADSDYLIIMYFSLDAVMSSFVSLKGICCTVRCCSFFALKSCCFVRKPVPTLFPFESHKLFLRSTICAWFHFERQTGLSA